MVKRLNNNQVNNISQAIRGIGGDFYRPLTDIALLIKDLSDTLFVTNIILGIIAVTLIVHTFFVIKNKKI